MITVTTITAGDGAADGLVVAKEAVFGAIREVIVASREDHTDADGGELPDGESGAGAYRHHSLAHPPCPARRYYTTATPPASGAGRR